MPALAHSVSLKSIAAVLGGGRAFTPASLFAASEPGGWYDPSDLTTLYQDAAGTTPVTAVEQPVGLVLDKSRGLVLGSELVTNGDFSSNTWWTASGGSAISGGALVFTNAIATSGAYRLGFATVGKYYELTFEIVSISSGGVQIGLGDSKGTNRTSVGVYTQRLLCTGNTNLTLYSVGASTTATVDNVSIKEVQGSHLSQSTAAARPVLSARVNLLTYTEQFDNAAWTKNQATISANAVTAPNGTLTADRLTATGTATYAFQTANSLANTPYVFSVSVLKGTSFSIAVDNAINTGRAVTFDGSTGAFVTFNTLGAGYTVSSYSCVTHPLDANYWLASMTVTPNAGTNNIGVWINTSKTSAYGAGISTIGDTLTVWGADLRPANAGVGLPAYQRVGAATSGSSTAAGNADYDTTGFPLFLRFDGTDDFLQSSTITPGSVDKAQVFAGVRVVGSASGGFILETSADITANNGSLHLVVPNTSPFSGRGFRSGGTVAVAADTANNAYPAPISQTLSGLSDISGDLATLRVNGTQAAQSTADQGTGNYLAYPLYVGRRGGTTLPFNGHLYSLILRFSAANLDAATITATETWVNGKTRAF